MGSGTIFQLIADGGTQRRHYECRLCGENLDSETGQCPACGGEVAVYELA